MADDLTVESFLARQQRPAVSVGAAAEELTPESFLRRQAAPPAMAALPAAPAKPSDLLPHPDLVDQAATAAARKFVMAGMEQLGGVPPGPPAAPVPFGLQSVEEHRAGAPVFVNPRTGQRSPRMPAGEGGFLENLFDTPVTGGQRVAGGVEQMAAPGAKAKAGGASEILRGGMEMATPLVAGGLATAPLKAGLVLGTGMVLQAGTEKLLKAAGVPAEYAALGSDVVAIFGAGGAYAKLRGLAKLGQVREGNVLEAKLREALGRARDAKLPRADRAAARAQAGGLLDGLQASERGEPTPVPPVAAAKAPEELTPDSFMSRQRGQTNEKPNEGQQPVRAPQRGVEGGPTAGPGGAGRVATGPQGGPADAAAGKAAEVSAPKGVNGRTIEPEAVSGPGPAAGAVDARAAREGRPVHGTPPPGAGRASGEETDVVIPGEERAIRARYEVRELADVQPSHHGQTFAPNERYARKNERDYAKPENQQRVIENSSEERFNPRYHITDDPTATNGPVLVDEDGNAIGGNSRAMMLQRVYAREGRSATAYRDLLTKKAAQFGIDPEAVRAMKQPVLVRVASNAELESLPGGSRWAVRKTNVSGTAELSTSERAAADAGQLAPELVEHIAGAIEAAGPDATLNDALTGKTGTAIVNRLIAEGFFSEQERPALMDGRTGALTQLAKDRISKAMLGQFFRDSDQIARTPASIRQKLERIAAPLAKVQGNAAWDLAPAFREAIDLLEYAGAHGIKNLGDVVAQTSMFGEAAPWRADAIRLAELLRDAKPNDLVAAVRRYVNDREPTMFGETTSAESFRQHFGGEKAERPAAPADQAPAAAPVAPSGSPGEPVAPPAPSRVARRSALLDAERARLAKKTDAALKVLAEHGKPHLRKIAEELLAERVKTAAAEAQRLATREISGVNLPPAAETLPRPGSGKSALGQFMGEAKDFGRSEQGTSMVEAILASDILEVKDLIAKRHAALKALKEAQATPGEQRFGQRLVEYYTGERDLWVSRVNQVLDRLKKLVPSAVEREGISILRDFTHRPGGELQSWLDGSHPNLATLEGADYDAAMQNIERLRPSIEAALNPTPRMLEANAVLTRIAEASAAEGVQRGFLEKGLDPQRYFTHLLHQKGEGDVPVPVGDRLGKALGGKIGRRYAFAEHREYPTILDAIADNVKPKTLDPFTAFAVHGDKFATARATHLLIDQLHDSNFAKWGAPHAKNIPEGWKEIAPHAQLFRNEIRYEDSETGEQQVGTQTLFVHPVVEKALRPITDPDYMSRLPGFTSARMFQAYTKAVQLGLSFFHATTENYMALANMGPRGWMEGLKADRESPEFLRAERDFVTNGGTTPILGRTVEAYKALEPGSIPTWGEIWKRAPLIREIDQLAQKITDFTFDNLQRKFKVTDWQLHRAAWLAEHPGASAAETGAAMSSIAKEINAVYGGLNWERIGVNHMTVEVARAIMLAPDWTISNIFNLKYSIERGTPAGKLARMFWVRQVAGGMMATQLLSLLLSRQMSPRPTMVYMGKDSEGQEIYQNIFFKGAPGDVTNLITNIKDYGVPGGLGRSMSGKAAPILRTGLTVLMNRDYLGRQLIPKGMNPVAATVRGAYEIGKGLAPTPLSLVNLKDMLVGPNASRYTVPEWFTTPFAGNPPQHVAPEGFRMTKDGLREKRETPRRSVLDEILSGKR